MNKTTRTFKSGNSIAVRLPAALGIPAGIEMRVRQERGRYVLEPVEQELSKIDLTGVWGSLPDLKLLTREDRTFKKRERDWDGKRLKGG